MNLKEQDVFIKKQNKNKIRDDKKERLAMALRENLKKRKMQKRQREEEKQQATSLVKE